MQQLLQHIPPTEHCLQEGGHTVPKSQGICKEETPEAEPNEQFLCLFQVTPETLIIMYNEKANVEKFTIILRMVETDNFI